GLDSTAATTAITAGFAVTNRRVTAAAASVRATTAIAKCADRPHQRGGGRCKSRFGRREERNCRDAHRPRIHEGKIGTRYRRLDWAKQSDRAHARGSGRTQAPRRSRLLRVHPLQRRARDPGLNYPPAIEES